MCHLSLKKANYRSTIVLTVIFNKLILSERDLWQRVSLLAMTHHLLGTPNTSLDLFKMARCCDSVGVWD